MPDKPSDDRADTIFHKIVRGEIPNYTVWQDDNYLAFLTPYANTPGLTVVIPKSFEGDNVLDMTPEAYQGLATAVKTVGGVLRRAFNTTRVAIVFEGTGVAYVHAKLYPLHGELAAKTGVWSKQTDFSEQYRGYITTIEGPEMEKSELERLQSLIQKAAASNAVGSHE